MKTRNKPWKCKICSAQKNKNDYGIECEICSEITGLECTNYTPEVYNYLSKNKIELSFICQPCKATLPELKSMLELTQSLLLLKETAENHDTRITACEVKTEKITNFETQLTDMNQRLSDLEAKLINQQEVETIAQKCFKSSEFPPLNLDAVKKTQIDTQKQLEEARDLQTKGWEEVQRREDNQKNLIIYSIPEEHDDNKTEQMKADFETLKKLYDDKVDIISTDLIQISRVGRHKPNQIRPIRITLADMKKRSEILRNNKNLKLYKEDHTCNLEFCDDEEPHKHIYISTDKTQLQRNEETKLRAELARRRETETDLIIRNGRIVRKSATHARWSEIAKDGF